jgi:glycerophosphoryl diester phosphodiesterase
MVIFAANSPAIAFDLQGHRGARGLAPENTIEGFRTALSIGVTTLELDLAMTKDGVLVVHHDERLDPDITRGPDGAFLAHQGPAIYSLTLEGHCHGKLERRLKAGSLRDAPGLLRSSSVPTCGDPARGLALSALHAELP